METSVKRVENRNYPKDIRLSKTTDMTIHWKTLEKHFLMVPLVVQFNNSLGKNVHGTHCSRQVTSAHVLFLSGHIGAVDIENLEGLFILSMCNNFLYLPGQTSPFL
jgi:hypothetical protein